MILRIFKKRLFKKFYSTFWFNKPGRNTKRVFLIFFLLTGFLVLPFKKICHILIKKIYSYWNKIKKNFSKDEKCIQKETTSDNINSVNLSSENNTNSTSLTIVRGGEDVFKAYAHLWTYCDYCKEPIYKKLAKENNYLCMYCGSHLPMESSERIECLIDSGTWDPTDKEMIEEMISIQKERKEAQVKIYNRVPALAALPDPQKLKILEQLDVCKNHILSIKKIWKEELESLRQLRLKIFCQLLKRDYPNRYRGILEIEKAYERILQVQSTCLKDFFVKKRIFPQVFRKYLNSIITLLKNDDLKSFSEYANKWDIVPDSEELEPLSQEFLEKKRETVMPELIKFELSKFLEKIFTIRKIYREEFIHLRDLISFLNIVFGDIMVSKEKMIQSKDLLLLFLKIKQISTTEFKAYLNTLSYFEDEDAEIHTGDIPTSDVYLNTFSYKKYANPIEYQKASQELLEFLYHFVFFRRVISRYTLLEQIEPEQMQANYILPGEILPEQIKAYFEDIFSYHKEDELF